MKYGVWKLEEAAHVVKALWLPLLAGICTTHTNLF